MYNKPYVANKVLMIRQLVNIKTDEGGYVTNHDNKFNSINIKIYVDIGFDNKVQSLCYYRHYQKAC